MVKSGGPVLTTAKSAWDNIIRKQPKADFIPGTDGILLHIKNVQSETIIIEDVRATPPLLGFAPGQEVDDMVRAIVHREAPRKNALLVLKPGEEMNLIVAMARQSEPEQLIRVTIHWRASSCSLFSKIKLSKNAVGLCRARERTPAAALIRPGALPQIAHCPHTHTQPT